MVKIGEDFFKILDNQDVRRKRLLIHKECKPRRRTNHQRKGDVARKCLSGIGQGMVPVVLAQSVRRGTLEFQKLATEREARRHFGERAFVCAEAGGIQRAHRRKNLLAGFDVDTRLSGIGLGLTERRGNSSGAEQQDDCSEDDRRGKFLRELWDDRTPQSSVGSAENHERSSPLLIQERLHVRDADKL